MNSKNYDQSCVDKITLSLDQIALKYMAQLDWLKYKYEGEYALKVKKFRIINENLYTLSNQFMKRVRGKRDYDLQS